MDVTSDVEKPEMSELDSCDVRDVRRSPPSLHFVATLPDDHLGDMLGYVRIVNIAQKRMLLTVLFPRHFMILDLFIA